MQLQTYKNASNIEEKYLPELAERQAECWGAKPFEEYRICSNDDCKALFSIEEVLGNLIEIRSLQSSQKDFKCTECGDETEEIYERERFISLIQEYFLGEVSAILIIDDQDSVEGFGVISKTTIRGVMEMEFNTRPRSYEIEETIKKLGRILYDDENAENKDVICFHQIYLSPLIRNSKLSYEALKRLFEINKENYKDIPLVGETRYDNKFYSILRSMGVKNLTDDKYGYILQTLPKYSGILEFLDTHSGYQDFLGEMIKFKRESQSILTKRPELSGRKFYK